MLKCKQASVLVSQSLDRKLSWGERVQLRLHLVICHACSLFRLQLGHLQAGMKSLVQEVEEDTQLEIPSAAKERINTAIKSSRY